MPNSAHIYDLVVAVKPQSTNDKSVGIDCCERFNFLASTTATGTEFNDSFLAVDRKASVSDSFAFTINKCGGSVLSNLGTEVVFPNDSLAVGFIFDLSQYLAAHGAGIYIINQVSTFLGATINREYAQIRLYEYTEEHAHKTVKIETSFDHKSKINGQFIDFTGSNAFSSLRMGGKFGSWQAQTETKEVIDYAYNSDNTATRNNNKYTLRLDAMSYLYSSRLIKLHLLAGTYHEITDHNYNHRPYTKYPVRYLSESISQDEPAVEQVITLDFGDRVVDEFSRHNGI